MHNEDIKGDPLSEKRAHEPTRREFLYLTAGAITAVGTAAAIWPFVHSMNPAADVLALATVDVSLSHIPPGTAITVTWRGKPVFIRRRTPEEIKKVQETKLSDLLDPQEDTARVKNPEWLVVIGVCTHLGCVPLGQRPTEQRGQYGGWLCPCHGSEYDASGRVRRGPAPTNLEVPTYTFLNENTIRIG